MNSFISGLMSIPLVKATRCCKGLGLLWPSEDASKIAPANLFLRALIWPNF